MCQSKDGRFQLNFFTLQIFWHRIDSDPRRFSSNFFRTVEPVEWTPRSDGLPLPLSLPNLSEMLAEGGPCGLQRFLHGTWLEREGDGWFWMFLFWGGVNVAVYMWDLFSNKETKKQSCQHFSDLRVAAMNLNIELEQTPAHSCRNDNLIT